MEARLFLNGSGEEMKIKLVVELSKAEAIVDYLNTGWQSDEVREMIIELQNAIDSQDWVGT